MENVTLHVFIERKTAIDAGFSQFGQAQIPVDPAELNETQRKLLHQICDTLLHGVFKCFTWDTSPTGQVHIEMPEVPPDIGNRVPEYLDWLYERIEQQSDLLKSQYASMKQEALTWTPELLVEKVQYKNHPGAIKSRLIDKPACNSRDGEDLKEVLIKDRAIKPTIDAYKQRCREHKEEVERQAREERETQEARRRNQLDNWVAQSGTDSQKKRYRRGLLPDNEIIDGIREEVFAPLADYPRYTPITKREVIASYYKNGIIETPGEANVAFDSAPAQSGNDADIAQIEAFEQRMPDAQITLRNHAGILKNTSERQDDIAAILRRSVHVAVDYGELTLSREFDVPYAM